MDEREILRREGLGSVGGQFSVRDGSLRVGTGVEDGLFGLRWVRGRGYRCDGHIITIVKYDR